MLSTEGLPPYCGDAANLFRLRLRGVLYDDGLRVQVRGRAGSCRMSFRFALGLCRLSAAVVRHPWPRWQP